uniref:Sorting nexin-17 n=2 Tax=Hirondellea gigas TaxID=1518452 RepID=A0A6A7FSN0_9CRUS
MHFSIPDTQELTDNNGSTYLAYNLQANGWQHCSLRYRQLLHLHQMLQHDLPSNLLPSFPPKRLFPLSASQVEERRQALEKYVLALSQETRVLLNHNFNGFLACAQHESYTGGGAVEEVPIQVYLMNGQRIIINGTDAMQSQHLLQKVCNQISLSLELMNDFALFIVRKKDNELRLVKKLQNFECPYISLKSLRGSHRIVLRKNYWVSSSFYCDEERVISDLVGLGLVYGQVVAEVQFGWLLVSDEQHQILAQLQASGQKREYLKFASSLSNYGSLLFGPCIADFPVPNTKIYIAVGNNELSFRVKEFQKNSILEGNFRVTRIRCWRISTHQTGEDAVGSPADSPDSGEGSSSPLRTGDAPSNNNSSNNKTSNRQNSTASTSTSSGFSSSRSISNSSINNPADHEASAAGATSNGDSNSPGCTNSRPSSRHNHVDNPLQNQGSTGPLTDGAVARAQSSRGGNCINGGKGSCKENSKTISSLDNNGSSSWSSSLYRSSEETGAMLELSFECLMRSEKLRWVRVWSSQAVLMSLCLQSIVQHLLSADAGTNISTPPAAPTVTEQKISYIRRDGSSVMLYTHSSRQPRNNTGSLAALGELSLRRLTETLAEIGSSSSTSTSATVPASSAQQQQQQSSQQQHRQATGQYVVENSAFNTITDRHL